MARPAFVRKVAGKRQDIACAGRAPVGCRPTARSKHQPHKIIRQSIAVLLASTCLGAGAAHAQNAAWNGATTDWNTATNWTPNTVPTGTATFTNTGSATVDNASGNVTIGAVSFSAVPNAQAFTVNIDNTFIINGAGVTNNSTNTQIFNVDPLS
jgi:hypothetical protein